ncbi:ferric reductase-like transmembrane domain-containing protein [Lysinibacillus sp. NPDC059133]|uniref:ferric reductase-like transmembrane domain-containing protein n=1 Tax=Lysinibacillus sp. NPDC059133 TaxID=3346737 RepID=UPI0036D0B5EE
MIISEIIAWFAVIFTVLLALKYIARISKNRQLNRLFRKSHKHFGILMITTGLLHGVLAGNEKTTNLFDMQLMPKLFTLNLGTFCLFASLLLALTYMLRKKLKKRWIFLHRVLTVILLVLLILHVHEEIERQHQYREANFPDITEQSLSCFWLLP